MIQTLPLDLSTFLRSICPGILIMVFLFWRKGAEISSYSATNVIPLMVLFSLGIIISGFSFYGFYRAIFYYPLIRYLEKLTVGIPQYEFHLSILRDLDAPPKARTLAICHAIYPNIIAKTDNRNHFYIFNSYVHLVFMSSILSLFFSICDFMFLGIQSPWILRWFLLFIILLLLGINIDHHSDLRETMFLVENKKVYKKTLQDYIKTL
ncbi:Uncharacterised protein [uncultured archaeon]|nr:Uncharacterised protein [uncultured archaeon]